MHMNYSGNDVHHFNYVGERFADLQLLRYRLNGFEQLSLLQKQLVYYLSKATLYGRDITGASVRHWKPSIPTSG